MAAQTVTLKATGLQTFYQTLMETPPGALIQANNTVINREGVIEPRRGFKQYTAPFANNIKQLFEYKTRVLSHIDNKISYDDGSGTFTQFQGTYLEPETGYRIKSTEAKSNFYFTTNEGVKKISAKTAADFALDSALNPIIEDVGGPKAIAGTLIPVSPTAPSTGFLPPGDTVNYRILWLYTDRNDNLIFGAPSASMLVENTFGTNRDVQLTFQVPYNVKVGYKYRIYRSEISPSGAPSDELYQVKEVEITSPLPTSITVIDDLDETFRVSGVPLYTNQYSGEGILKSNEPPPSCKDIALFKGHMFYANTRTRYSLEIKLLTNTGLTGKKLVIGSNNYPFTVGLTITDTAKNLVNSINANSSEVVTAYYLSVTGEPEGKIFLQRKTLVNTTFNVSSDAPVNSFSPDLSVAKSGITETIGNRIYYSKYQEHEAVPLLNYIDIGSKDQEIERIISLRESLFILKGDGVFRLAGDPGSNPVWDVGAFDSTSLIKAPDTAVTLENQCYYFSNQGIMRLNESSLEPISNPIKDKLVPFITTNPNLNSLAFAVGYESDNALLVFTCLNKIDTKATVCYRYHTKTQAWTEWKITKTCGIVNQHLDKVFLGGYSISNSAANYIEVERKNFNRFDQADYEIPITVSTDGLNGNVIKPSGFNNIQEGDVILQEQGVTIYQFNSLLKHLDLDNGLGYYNFYNDFQLSAGKSLRDTMDLFVPQLDTVDPSGGYAALWTSPTSFTAIQTQFNAIVNALNSVSTATFLKNYKTSDGITTFEAIVLSINLLYQEATLSLDPSFMIGPLILYKAIRTEIEYAPQHAGDPSGFKQFHSGVFMFNRRSFYTATTAYNSDISDNYEEIKFIPNVAGTFGGTVYGEQIIFGGAGDQAQIRTYIPLKKQRCRFLGCKFQHNVALESYQLYGLAISYRTYNINDRDYR